MGTKLVSISIAVTWRFLPSRGLAIKPAQASTVCHPHGDPLGVFIVQWIDHTRDFILSTTDLVGSLTYITVTILAVQQAADFGLRQQLIVVVITGGATRPFLFM